MFAHLLACLFLACLCLLVWLFVCLFSYSITASFVSMFVSSLVRCVLVCVLVCYFVRAFVRSFVLSFVCLLLSLSFAFVLRNFLVGSDTARVGRNRIYEKTGGESKETTAQQNTKSPRKQQEFRFKRRRLPKARFQLGRPRSQPRKPDSSPEGPRKQEFNPKPPTTARMRQKPRNRRKGT